MTSFATSPPPEPVLWIARTHATDHPVPQLAEHLRRLGWPVRVVAWGEPRGRKAPYLRRWVLDPRPHPRREPRAVHVPSWRFVRDIARAPERIVVHRDLGPVAAVVGLARRWRPAIRSVALLEHHLRTAGPAATTWWKRWPRRYCARQPTVVLANHRRAAEQADELGVDASRIVTGWWMAGLAQGVVESPSASGPIRLVALGKLIPRKGIDLLLDAMAQAVADGADLTLTVIGDGEARSSLEVLTEAHQLQERVTFAGHLPHHGLARLMASHHLAVMPSYEDHTGRAAIEAMSLGLPVLASSRSGIAEILVEPGRNGLVADPTDTAAFAAILGDLDHAELQLLRTAVAETAEHLGEAACAASVLTGIQQALSVGDEM